MSNMDTRYCSSVLGPQGQTVIITPVTQFRLPIIREAESGVLYTICLFVAILLGSIFTIIGFALMCVGFSYMSTEPDHPVLYVGLIFFGIGSFFCIKLCAITCCRGRSHQKQVERYMHYPSHSENRENIQPIIHQNLSGEMSPYQRFMRHGGQNTSIAQTDADTSHEHRVAGFQGSNLTSNSPASQETVALSQPSYPVSIAQDNEESGLLSAESVVSRDSNTSPCHSTVPSSDAFGILSPPQGNQLNFNRVADDRRFGQADESYGRATTLPRGPRSSDNAVSFTSISASQNTEMEKSLDDILQEMEAFTATIETSSSHQT